MAHRLHPQHPMRISSPSDRPARDHRASPPHIVGVVESERPPEQVADHTPPTTLVILEALRAAGETELERGAGPSTWSGVAGGLVMGISVTAAGLLHAHLPDATWRPLVAAFGVTLGFVVVIIGRFGLITEVAVSSTLPLLASPSRATTMKLLRLVGCVLVGNLIGAALFALVAARTELFTPETRAAFLTIGERALAPPFAVLVLRALAAGWLVGLATWSVAAAPSARVSLVVLILWPLGAAELAHVITGSVETLTVVFSGEASFLDFVGFFTPVLLGNLIGGAVLVASLNHLQVAREQRRARAARAHGQAPGVSRS